jgi:hypothetical protein
MTFEQRLTAAMAQAAIFVCIVGLVRTGRWRLCVGFLGYALALISLGPLQTWCPRFNTWAYWSFKETVYSALKLALSAELAARVCRDFPGAKARAERYMLLVLLLVGAGLVLKPWSRDWLQILLGDHLASIAVGSLWLLVSTAIVVRHSRLPVHPFHLGLLVGFAAHQAFFGFLLRLVRVVGWDAGYQYGNALGPPAAVVFACWVAWISWRPDGEATIDYERVVNIMRKREVTA